MEQDTAVGYVSSIMFIEPLYFVFTRAGVTSFPEGSFRLTLKEGVRSRFPPVVYRPYPYW